MESSADAASGAAWVSTDEASTATVSTTTASSRVVSATGLATAVWFTVSAASAVFSSANTKVGASASSAISGMVMTSGLSLSVSSGCGTGVGASVCRPNTTSAADFTSSACSGISRYWMIFCAEGMLRWRPRPLPLRWPLSWRRSRPERRSLRSPRSRSPRSLPRSWFSAGLPVSSATRSGISAAWLADCSLSFSAEAT